MIKEVKNHVQKLVWLWVHTQGKTTPAEIVEQTGLKRTTVMHALASLRIGGFVIKVSAGLYCSATGTQEAQRNIFKQNKIKERKENFSTDEIFDHVDRTSETFLRLRGSARKIFQERGISQDLLDRIAAGFMLGLPGLDGETLKSINEEAWEAVKENRVKHRWIHVANCIRRVFEAAGWTWTKCRTEREKQLQELNRIREEKRAAAALAAAPEEKPKPENSGKIVQKKAHRATGKADVAEDSLTKLGEKLRAKTG